MIFLAYGTARVLLAGDAVEEEEYMANGPLTGLMIADGSGTLEIGGSKRTVMLKLYTELSTWWPLLSPPDDYLDEANFFHQVLVAARLPPEPTLLELGCGGGNNAVHLKARFAWVTLTELSPQMLAVSRTLNPDCEHLVGDMQEICARLDLDAPLMWSLFTTLSTT